MSDDLVNAQLEQGVLTLTLNRAHKLNAYDAEMGQQIKAAFEAADRDDSVRAVIVTGAGRAFCAGADLAAFADSQRGISSTLFGSTDQPRQQSAWIEAIFRCRKPIIAAINGPAIGVGLTFTLPMDLRIAAPSAKFSLPFTRLGLVPEAGSAFFLPKLVGITQSLRWCCSGNTFTAAEALNAGLISEVVETDELMSRAQQIATEMTAYSAPVSIALTRRMLWGLSAEADLQALLTIDGPLARECAAGADMAEGIAAFTQKRPPQFRTQVSSGMPSCYDIWKS